MPLSLNLYIYAYSNPLRYVDTSGHVPEDAFTAGDVLEGIAARGYEIGAQLVQGAAKNAQRVYRIAEREAEVLGPALLAPGVLPFAVAYAGWAAAGETAGDAVYGIVHAWETKRESQGAVGATASQAWELSGGAEFIDGVSERSTDPAKRREAAGK